MKYYYSTDLTKYIEKINKSLCILVLTNLLSVL